MHVYVCAHACAWAHLWRSEDTEEVRLLLLPHDSQYQILDVTLGHRHLYPLSILASSRAGNFAYPFACSFLKLNVIETWKPLGSIPEEKHTVKSSLAHAAAPWWTLWFWAPLARHPFFSSFKPFFMNLELGNWLDSAESEFQKH